jgi:hypothetical protein
MPYSTRNAATAARPPGLLSRSVTPRIMAREAHAGHRPAGRANKVGGVSRLTLAGKIVVILKLSVVASVLLASSSVGYYYLVYLPHRDAQFEPERVLERLRAAAQKRAEQEQLLFEQQASERRAAEQQAVEERQALEKANRYQACLSRATDNYNASRLAVCNRPREKIIKDRDDCIKGAGCVHVVSKPTQAYEPKVPVKVRERIGPAGRPSHRRPHPRAQRGPPGVRWRPADVRRRCRVRGRVRPPRLVQRLRTRPRGGGPRPGPSFAGAGGDRRAAGGYSPVVPVRLPCGGRRRRLSLGTGLLGLLTACWVQGRTSSSIPWN